MTSFLESFFTTPTFIGPEEDAEEWQLITPVLSYADALKQGPAPEVDAAIEREANEKKIAITTPQTTRTTQPGEKVNSETHSCVPSPEHEVRWSHIFHSLLASVVQGLTIELLGPDSDPLFTSGYLFHFQTYALISNVRSTARLRAQTTASATASAKPCGEPSPMGNVSLVVQSRSITKSKQQHRDRANTHVLHGDSQRVF